MASEKTDAELLAGWWKHRAYFEAWAARVEAGTTRAAKRRAESDRKRAREREKRNAEFAASWPKRRVAIKAELEAYRERALAADQIDAGLVASLDADLAYLAASSRPEESEVLDAATEREATNRWHERAALVDRAFAALGAPDDELVERKEGIERKGRVEHKVRRLLKGRMGLGIQSFKIGNERVRVADMPGWILIEAVYRVFGGVLETEPSKPFTPPTARRLDAPELPEWQRHREPAPGLDPKWKPTEAPLARWLEDPKSVKADLRVGVEREVARLYVGYELGLLDRPELEVATEAVKRLSKGESWKRRERVDLDPGKRRKRAAKRKPQPRPGAGPAPKGADPVPIADGSAEMLLRYLDEEAHDDRERLYLRLRAVGYHDADAYREARITASAAKALLARAKRNFSG